MVDVESRERAVELAATLRRSRPEREADVRVDRGPGGHVGRPRTMTRRDREPTRRLDEGALRGLVPQVLGRLRPSRQGLRDGRGRRPGRARRGGPQLAGAHRRPIPRAWLITVAQRRLIDVRRSEAARRRREEAQADEPEPEARPSRRTTRWCCLDVAATRAQPASADRADVAGGRRAGDGARSPGPSRPEATMAQRISRAKRSLVGQRFDQPGESRGVARALRDLHEGTPARSTWRARRSGSLASRAVTNEPEVHGLLA